jgi:hypothetical protein
MFRCRWHVPGALMVSVAYAVPWLATVRSVSKVVRLESSLQGSDQ